MSVDTKVLSYIRSLDSIEPIGWFVLLFTTIMKDIFGQCALAYI